MNMNKTFTVHFDITDIALMGIAFFSLFTFTFFLFLWHLLAPDGSIHFLIGSMLSTPYGSDVVTTPLNAILSLAMVTVGIGCSLYIRHKYHTKLAVPGLYPESMIVRARYIYTLVIPLLAVMITLPTFLALVFWGGM